jgi:hypothetical protein
MAKKPPRLGGELPAYHTMGATKPKKRSMMTLGAPMTSKTVQRSPRENIGTPGTSKFVQRSPKVNTGTPGSKNFVQRTPGNSSQRMPSSVMNTLRSKLTAPRKPAK